MADTIVEEILVTGEELLAKIRKLIREGNVKRLIIKNSKGEAILETPLTYGAAGLGGFIFLAPFLSAVAFIALMLSEATIVVERDPSRDEKEVEAEDIEVVDS